MNAAETIKAAIDKLEVLKAKSTPSPWHYWADDLTGDVDLWHDQEQRSWIATLGIESAPTVLADAELIVTLHRTIDAQLVLLRWFLAILNTAPGYGPPNGNGHMALATAILGGDS